MVNKKKKGFTLVELLAVIVILAVILVIAVPQIMSTIEESRNGAFASSAKLIASSAETLKLTNDTLGIEKTINCDDVAEYNNDDYQSCSITFDEGEAQVTLAGKGKFAGKYVCAGTRTNAVVTEESCTLVSLTVDPNEGTNTAEYEAKYEAGSKVTLTEPTREGYTFNGWEVTGTNASVTGNELTIGTTATTVKATWTVPTAADIIAAKVGSGGLTATTASNGDTTYDAGIRYVGATDAVANKVYFNCEAKDSAGVSYGENTYKYASSCEIWRIIGVFDVEDGSGNTEKRMKIINTESTFTALWDSSASATNSGYGINQWGPSTLIDVDGNEQPYAGADLMQLLNGYYIGKTGSECKYNNARSYTDGFSQTCTTSSLTTAKMKPLTSSALSMIEDAVWYTYAIDTWPQNTTAAVTAYLQERGITQQYVGNSLCTAGTTGCDDKVKRTTTWTGLVGLMSVGDIGYANGWLFTPGISSYYAWTISPFIYAASSNAYRISLSSANYLWDSAGNSVYKVWPSVYLKADVKIIGGDGSTTPYKLSI